MRRRCPPPAASNPARDPSKALPREGAPVFKEDPRFKKLQLALFNRPAVEAAFFAAHARAFDLREELRELELHIAQAQEVLDLIPIRPWPPLPTPMRPPTLHQAIQSVLETRGNEWMRARDVATEVARRSLYRRRDGLPASAKDVSARISAYPGLFRRDGPLVRLRIDP